MELLALVHALRLSGPRGGVGCHRRFPQTTCTIMASAAVRGAWAVVSAIPVAIMIQEKVVGLHYISPSSESALLWPASDRSAAAEAATQSSKSEASGGRWALFRKDLLVHAPNTPQRIPSWLLNTDSPRAGDVVRVPQPSGSGPCVYRRVRGAPGNLIQSKDGFTEFVGPGRLWLETDSPDVPGDDSREWGQVPLSMVRGVAHAVVWPLGEAGLVQRDLPMRRVDSMGLLGQPAQRFRDAQDASLRKQQQLRNAMGDAFPFSDQVPAAAMPEEVEGSADE